MAETYPVDAPNATAAKTPQPGQKTLTAEQVTAWRQRITAALAATKPVIEQGKTNVARYQGQYLATTPTADTVLVPSDFYYTEAKKSRLLYRLPDVFVKPELPGLEDAAVVFQAALNKRIGPKGLNILPTAKQVVFDVLCPTGYGAICVGYQTAVDPAKPTVPVQVGEEPDPDAPVPALPVGSVLGLQAPPMKPIFEDAPNIVAKWYFSERVKPGDLIVPPDFCDLDFDKAPYLGQRFKEDADDDVAGSSSGEEEDRRLTPLPSEARVAQKKQRTGYEIQYRAYLFDDDVQHPDKIRLFKVYDDDTDAPVVVRDHPHQRYKNPAGELLKGMRGYTISVLTLRYVSDTWLAPSDCTMARNIADELSKGRTQMLVSRDRSMPQWGFDATRVDKDKQAAIERNEIQGGVPFNGPGQDATWPIQKGERPRQTYEFNEIAQRDLDRIWRLPPNSRGEIDQKAATATEQQIAASSSQEADEADRGVVLSWLVEKVVTKIAALMQLYADEQEFVELVGADAQRLKIIPPEVQQAAKAAGQDARVLVPFNKAMIDGPFAFSAKPNSQVYLDAAQALKRKMDMYQFLANSPNVNKAEMERDMLAEAGYDPTKAMQAPPKKESAAPSVALSVKGEDFNPQMPQAPILLDALSKLGVPIDLAAVQTAIAKAEQLTADQITAEGLAETHPQSEHGGAAAQAEPLSKHAADATGGMQGSGAPAPMAPGGMR